MQAIAVAIGRLETTIGMPRYRSRDDFEAKLVSRDVKSSYTTKQKRQAWHIEDG